MIVIINANGDILLNTVDKVKQGSNGANKITIFAPLTQGISCTVSYKLPTGILSYPVLMTPLENNESDLSAWSVGITKDITAYSGIVQVQFNFYTTGQPIYNENDEIIGYDGNCIASALTSFEVLKGVTPINPTIPSDTVYNSILTLLSNLSAGYDELLQGNVLSKGLLPYDSYYTYKQGVIVQANENFYLSLQNDNTGNPVTDIAYWKQIKFEPLPIPASQTQLGGIYIYNNNDKLIISTSYEDIITIYNTLSDGSQEVEILPDSNVSITINTLTDGSQEYIIGDL